MDLHKWRNELKRSEADHKEIGLPLRGMDLTELRGIAAMEEQLELLWNRLNAAEQSAIDIDRRARKVK